MDIRHLQYLIALAREEHFTKAALACGVTQPTLSGRIRQLEQELGVPIVARNQKYFGLTPEGKKILKWAQLILDNWNSLNQELALIRNGQAKLSGRIVLGVIPSALPMVATLTAQMQRRHPAVDFSILSHSSEEIINSVNDFTLDAGITYLDNEPISGLQQISLYTEHYSLYLPDSHRLGKAPSLSWSEAATLPLALLTGNMQNRRIIDKVFRSVQAIPQIKLETNSILNLMSSVQLMGLASIMPTYILKVLGPQPGIATVALTDPVVEHQVGLVALKRDPPAALVAELFAAATRLSATPIIS